MIIMEKKYDTICLSGGGVKGISFIGALEYIEENKYIELQSINNFVGTSIGSIVSFFLSLDYTIEEIKEFIMDFNFTKLIPEINIENILLLHGVDTGEKIMLIVSHFLKEKYNIDDITFEEHYKLTNKKLTIIGTNFTKSCEEVFNYELTPNISVLTAIRISMSIPIMFTPVHYNDNYYIDGGVVNNFPLNHCNPNTTLGIYIKNSNNNMLENIISLSIGCISIITDNISIKHCINNNYDIIEIKNYNAEFTNFELTSEIKQKLYTLGIEAAKIFKKNPIIIKTKDQNIQTQDQSTQTE